jgi:hypothetical protein
MSSTASDKIKKVIETEVLLAYPDFDKAFHIYIDASIISREQQ